MAAGCCVGIVTAAIVVVVVGAVMALAVVNWVLAGM